MSLSLQSAAGFTRADLRAVEREQMRRLLEHPLPQSMQASQAIAPVMSLADCWSPLPANDDALTGSAAPSSHWPTLPASPQPQLLPDDEQLSFLSHDQHSLLHSKLQLPTPPASPPSDFAFASVLPYSGTADCYPAFAPATAAASRKRGLDEDELLPSFLQRSISSNSASCVSELQLSSKKASSGQGGGSDGRAAYPLLSSALVDGFFASSVNMSGSVMGGLDDAELDLLPPEAERLVKAEQSGERSGDRPGMAKQPSLPHALPSSRPPLPPLAAHSPSRASQLSSYQSSAASSASSTKSSLSSSSFSAAPLYTSPTSAASVAVSSPASIADAESVTEGDGQGVGEGGRRAKRRLTDKQRRAKIKDGLEQLRSLVALHGSSSSDQAAIVNSSVDLVQQLVTEKDKLRQQVRLLRDERADIEREQRALRMTAAAVLSSSSSSSSSSSPHAADAKQQPKLGLLLQHLLSVLNANNSGGGGGGSGGGLQLGEGGEVTASIDQLLLSQYFLQSLQSINKSPRNGFDSL